MKHKTMEDAAREMAKLIKQLDKIEYHPPEWHVWSKLYHKVGEFITTDFVHEILSFVVKVEGEPDAHCVVALNETGKYGLVAYRGRPVLRSEDQEPGEAMLEMDAISLTFVTRQDLTPSERKHLRDHKVACKGEYSYPYFRSIRPFLEPWPLSFEEVPWLTQVLEGAVVAGQIAQSEPEVFGEEVLEELVLERDDGQWVVDLELPELELTPYETLT